jgi:hypothetical protein
MGGWSGQKDFGRRRRLIELYWQIEVGWVGGKEVSTSKMDALQTTKSVLAN